MFAFEGKADMRQCPLLGAKQTLNERTAMSASDKADMSGSRLLPCKLAPKPYFASRKSLL
jgi:hypothetical protein